MTDLLQVIDLRKTFDGFVAIDDIALKLPAGRLTSIIGPNGAGKTTAINVITGLLRPDAGRILLDGQDITTLSADARVRRGLGRSFQISTVFPQLSVAENVLVPVLAHRGLATRSFMRWNADAGARAEVEELLSAFDLGPLGSEPAGNLAHGSVRMLEVAMALATRPRLCLLDEPCAGLNPAERRQILDQIQRLERDTDTTFVLVEHDMEVVFAVSEWIVVLVDGAVLTEGPPEQIREDPRVQRTYLGEEIADDAGTT